MQTQKTLVVPDLQYPYTDMKFYSKLLEVVRLVTPDAICLIGDVMDFPEVGRWTKAKSGEYDPTIQKSLDGCFERILKPLREATPKAAISYKLGNHDLRLEAYISDYAPALRSLRSSDLGHQLRLAELGIELKRQPFVLAPGVLAVHGHEQAYSSVPGRYEMERIKQYGMSVVAGHTHTPLVLTTAQGYGLKQKHFWGMNVGHGMDVKKVTYTKDGSVKWMQAFGIIETDSRGVSHPRLITAPGGRFTFAGQEF